MERSTLSARSRKLFTLSALYSANSALLAQMDDRQHVIAQDEHLANGLNVSNGRIRHQAVAEALDLEFDPA